MFLNLAHTRLDVFSVSSLLVQECYKVVGRFPSDERFSMVQQIRRAVLSVHLNIAEGCSRASPAERKRFFEISRSSLVEVDTAFDLSVKLGYCSEGELKEAGNLLIKTFKILCGLIGKRD